MHNTEEIKNGENNCTEMESLEYKNFQNITKENLTNEDQYILDIILKNEENLSEKIIEKLNITEAQK